MSVTGIEQTSTVTLAIPKAPSPPVRGSSPAVTVSTPAVTVSTPVVNASVPSVSLGTWTTRRP